MRAAAIERFGGPEVLTVHELPVPEFDEGEVLIALDRAGVGSWDEYSFANARGGFCTRYVAVAGENVPTIPKGLTMREAGSRTTALTGSRESIMRCTYTAASPWQFVGASGGVGTLAVQFAKLQEARVFGVASAADGVGWNWPRRQSCSNGSAGWLRSIALQK